MGQAVGTSWVVVLLGASLAVSIFWSLEALVYLHLRAAVDNEDSGTVALERQVAPSAESAAAKAAQARAPDPAGVEMSAVERSKEESAAAPGRPQPASGGLLGFVRTRILLFVALVGAWCLTFWLFGRASDGPTEWLGWALSRDFVPPAAGLYKVASLIAAFWGLVWFGAPIILSVRRGLRGTAPHQPMPE
jgi:hypothetical protein